METNTKGISEKVISMVMENIYSKMVNNIQAILKKMLPKALEKLSILPVTFLKEISVIIINPAIANFRFLKMDSKKQFILECFKMGLKYLMILISDRDIEKKYKEKPV